MTDSDDDVVVDSEPSRAAYRTDRATRKRARRAAERSLTEDTSRDPLQKPTWQRIRTAAEALDSDAPSLPCASNSPPPAPGGKYADSAPPSSSPHARFARLLNSRFSRTDRSVGSSHNPAAVATAHDDVAAHETVRRVLSNTPSQAATDELRLLAVIVACPVCDASWTARKTEAAKQTHIRSCAKKRRLSAEDVRTLIEQSARAAVTRTAGGTTVFDQTLHNVHGGAERIEVVGVAGDINMSQVRRDIAKERKSARQGDRGGAALVNTLAQAASVLDSIAPSATKTAAGTCSTFAIPAVDALPPSATPAFPPSRLQARLRKDSSTPGNNIAEARFDRPITNTPAQHGPGLVLRQAILRYEPIELDLLHTTLANHMKQRPILRRAVERQGITTFEAKSRANSRRRH